MLRRLVPVVCGFLMFGAPGWAGDGLVALQRAAPSCRNTTSNIYVNCGNGTVTDNRTGLVWLANANCIGFVTFSTAMEFAAGLSDMSGPAGDCGLMDGSAPGEWRLPSASEWQTMIANAVSLDCIDGQLGGPSITIDNGTGCWADVPELSSFYGVQANHYWSATTQTTSPIEAWHVTLLEGGLLTDDKTNTALVWPVRGGQ